MCRFSIKYKPSDSTLGVDLRSGCWSRRTVRADLTSTACLETLGRRTGVRGRCGLRISESLCASIGRYISHVLAKVGVIRVWGFISHLKSMVIQLGVATPKAYHQKIRTAERLLSANPKPLLCTLPSLVCIHRLACEWTY